MGGPEGQLLFRTLKTMEGREGRHLDLACAAPCSPPTPKPLAPSVPPPFLVHIKSLANTPMVFYRFQTMKQQNHRRSYLSRVRFLMMLWAATTQTADAQTWSQDALNFDGTSTYV